MEVTRTNFQEVLTELDGVLKNATFLSIDGEFTGLNSGPDARPFDTPAQYYNKLKSGSMDFLFVQFGLSVFTYDQEIKKYSQRSYNFYVFPKPLNRTAPDCRFMCQASSIVFLAANGFDFNKLFQSGISYLTTSDEERMNKRLEEQHKAREDGIDLIPISSDDKPQIEEICSRIEEFYHSDAEELFIDRCNAYIRRIIHQEVRMRWPNKIRVESKIDGAVQGLLVYKMGTEEEEKQREIERREKEIMEVKEAVGLSALLRKISESEKLIVGHNMLLDLCHIVHRFFGPLPDSYAEFKLLIHGLFPKLLDTKVISQLGPFKELISSSILSHMLETVSKSPFTMPDVIPVENRSYTTSREIYHEAGYDAYITGLCFIAMANYLGSLQSEKVTTVDPSSPLLNPFLNKLTMVRLKDYPYVNLVDKDPNPSRDHVFHITFPKEWKLSDISQLFTPFGGALVSWLTDSTAYIGLNRRDQSSTLIKKLKKNGHLNRIKIQPYETYQATLEQQQMKSHGEGDRKRKQSQTELSTKNGDANKEIDGNNDDGWKLASGKRRRKCLGAAPTANGKVEVETTKQKTFIETEMLRSVLERQGAAAEALNDTPGTPLRGHWTAWQRTRLIDKHLQSEQVPVYALPPSPETQQGTVRENFEYRPIPIYCTANSADRFIPQRFGYNTEISRLNLMSRESQNNGDDEHYLNVLHQVKTLNQSWRKRRMIRAIDELNILHGIGSHRVLNFTAKSSSTKSSRMPIYQDIRDKIIEDSSVSDVWKVRARSKPLIGNFEQPFKLPGYRHFPSRGVVDWSSTNVIVAAIEHKIYLFHDMHRDSPINFNIEIPEIPPKRIRCVKWDHNGEHIAMCSRSMHLVVFDVAAEKMVWRDKCPCENCIIRCLCWSNNDCEIITGCSEGRLSVFRTCCKNFDQSDRLMDCIPAHDGNVLSIGISPNNRYIVSTGLDKGVRVYLFPEMAIYLEIGYYDAVDTHAWHPWEAGMLCIGGGLGDGSLSLWDIPRQQCIGYRRVDFLSYVKHLAWNKLSGELVVVWYYWEDDTRSVTIPVLSSWDRVVDVVNFKQSGPNLSIANIIWNPEHTLLGLQTEDHIHCLNMFGNYTNVWQKKTNKKGKNSAGQRSIFDLYCIR